MKAFISGQDMDDLVVVECEADYKVNRKERSSRLPSTDRIIRGAELRCEARDNRRNERHAEVISRVVNFMRLMTTAEMQVVISAQEYFERNHFLVGSQRFALKVLYERYLERA